MKQLIEDLLSALEYHAEQTRPIHSTTVAIQAAKEALKTLDEKNAKPAEQQPPVSVQWLAEMIMSDCGCSTNNQRLLERITARIEQHIRANTPPTQQALREAADPVARAMSVVADEFAHKLALDLECVLSDCQSSRWWDTAMNTLSAYRSAMNKIHEKVSPTFMGEPCIEAALRGEGGNG